MSCEADVTTSSDLAWRHPGLVTRGMAMAITYVWSSTRIRHETESGAKFNF